MQEDASNQTQILSVLALFQVDEQRSSGLNAENKIHRVKISIFNKFVDTAKLSFTAAARNLV